MKIVLIQTVKKIGQKGDIKDIKDGFAMNYLIPRGLALPLGSAKAQSILAQTTKQGSAKKEIIQGIAKVFNALDNKEFKITKSKNKQGRYYAPIGVDDIAKLVQTDKKYLKSIVEIKIDKPQETQIKLEYKGQQASIKLVAT